MRTRRRHSFAFIGTAVFHAVVLLWGMFGLSPSLDIPEIDFELAEVELLDPDMLQGGAEQPEPPPQPEPEPAPTPEPTPPDTKAEDEAEKKRLAEEEEKKRKEAEEKKKKREEARKKRREQRKNFANKGTDADQLGPPTSTFHLLLVPKKIRKLPFAGTAFSLLEPWPDFDFLVRKGGLDPLKDFDHIVIASPNITNALDTFLAVDFKTSRKKVVRAIERAVKAEGQVIEWVDDGGFLRGNPRPADESKKDIDKRWFVFHPKKKVAMFVREAFLDQILADSDGPVGKDGTARQFVDNLTKLRKFASQQPLSGMQLKVADLSNTISGLRLPFPTPDLIEVSVEAAKAPIMVVKFGFTDVVQAKKFALWYGEDLTELMGGMKYRFTVKPIFDGITLTRSDETISLRTEFTQEQIEFVLDSLATFTKDVTSKADRKRGDRRKSG